MFSDINIQDALGSFTSGTVEQPGSPVASLSELTLRVTYENGDEDERVFNVVFDEDNETFRRGETDELYSTNFADNADLLGSEVTSELLTEAERTISITVDDNCLYGLDAPLGTGFSGPGTICFDERPTFEALARRALELVGIDLVIFHGPGLPFLTRKVAFDYRTEGKTVLTVLNETILVTQPRWWGAGTTMYVDGRAIPTGTFPTTIRDITQYTRSVEERPDIPEPVLELPDYEPPDNCQPTFETLDNATREWSVRSGTGRDEQEIYYRLVKTNGQITQEEERRYAFVPTVSTTEGVWSLVYEVIKTHEYHPTCGEALVESIEVTRQTRTDFAFWDFTVSPGLGAFGKADTIKDFIPELYEASRKVVTQRWHAEGWLQQRTESNLEAAGVIFNVFGSVGAIAYKRSSRTEEYTPKGGGQWWVRITENYPVDKPIYESITDPGQGATDYTLTGTFPVGVTNSYSRPTDGPPPQVTCSDAEDPCNPLSDPVAAAQDRYDFEVIRRQAIFNNLPDRNVWNVSIAGLHLNYRVGQFIGNAYVAAVTFNVDATGAASTELEIWTARVLLAFAEI